MPEDITSTEAGEKAMKDRCGDCKQLEGFISDSVYFNDGDHTIEDLLEFRKSGFMSDKNGEKCPCYKLNETNKKSIDK